MEIPIRNMNDFKEMNLEDIDKKIKKMLNMFDEIKFIVPDYKKDKIDEMVELLNKIKLNDISNIYSDLFEVLKSIESTYSLFFKRESDSFNNVEKCYSEICEFYDNINKQWEKNEPNSYNLYFIVNHKSRYLKNIMSPLYELIYKEVFVYKNIDRLDDLTNHIKEETNIIIMNAEKLLNTPDNKDAGYDYRFLVAEIMNIRQYLYMIKYE